MKAQYVSGVDSKTLLDPAASVWGQAKAESLKLMGTPAGMQPTDAIRTTWADKKIGAVENVDVQALHNGEALAFRLEWATPQANTDHGDNSVFPDGAAIAFPLTEAATVLTMGSPGNAINAWYWRANANGAGRQVTAEGIGSSETLDLDHVRGQGEFKDGKWTVTIVRALKAESAKPVAELAAGQTAKFAVAVWDGGSGERGGIKSFSGPMWLDLNIAEGK